MRALVLAFALGGCVTMPPSTGGVESLGNDTFTVSELTGFGSVVDRAARFCGQFGQTVEVQASTTEQGFASGRNYAVLVFNCI